MKEDHTNSFFNQYFSKPETVFVENNEETFNNNGMHRNYQLVTKSWTVKTPAYENHLQQRLGLEIECSLRQN